MALAFSILGPKDSNSLYSYNPPLKGSSKSECALLTLLVPYPCLTLTHIRTTSPLLTTPNSSKLLATLVPLTWILFWYPI